MALNPNSRYWRAEREGLDILALLVELEDRQKMILTQAFHEGSWDVVFDEARLMGPVLRRLKRDAQSWYCRIVALVEEQSSEE